jgi:transposase
MAERTTVTMGWDVGDRFTEVCLLGQDGSIMEQQRVRTTKHSLEKQLSRYPGALVVLEVGIHSRWISDLVRGRGHQVIVANARQVQLIYRRKSKTDRSDALLLARLGRFDPTLLAPVHHRSRSAQLDLACLRARDALVSARTDLINHIRGVLKPFGLRVPDCGSGAFVRHAEEAVPCELVPALGPVLECLRVLEVELSRYEKQVEHLATVSYPETARLSQVAGVGPITSLAYVLTIEDPSRFNASRTVGSFVGLTPAKDQSGESDPQKRISRAGDPFLRRLLVQCAHFILGPFGQDSDLRRWGLRLAERGEKSGKKKAVIAVARKLAALLHRLWVSGNDYQAIGYGSTGGLTRGPPVTSSRGV